MKCRKCKAEVPDNSKFCNMCGARLTIERKTKSRGNGTGSVYKRGSNWTVVIVEGYITDADGKIHRKTRSKAGFKTKKEAIEYIPILKRTPAAKEKMRRLSSCTTLGFPRIEPVKTQ